MTLRQIRLLFVLVANSYWIVRLFKPLLPAFTNTAVSINLFNVSGGSAQTPALFEPVVLVAGIILEIVVPKVAPFVNCAYYFGVGSWLFYLYTEHITKMAAAPTRSVIISVIYIAIGLTILALSFESKPKETPPVDMSQHW